MADFARGEKLRRLRTARHLSQEDAAHEIGVTSKTLRSWEHGGPISWKNALRAGDFYEVEAEALVSRELAQSELNGEPSEALDRIEQRLIEVQAEVARIATQLAADKAPAPPHKRSARS